MSENDVSLNTQSAVAGITKLQNSIDRYIKQAQSANSETVEWSATLERIERNLQTISRKTGLTALAKQADEVNRPMQLMLEHLNNVQFAIATLKSQGLSFEGLKQQVTQALTATKPLVANLNAGLDALERKQKRVQDKSVLKNAQAQAKAFGPKLLEGLDLNAVKSAKAWENLELNIRKVENEITNAIVGGKKFEEVYAAMKTGSAAQLLDVGFSDTGVRAFTNVIRVREQYTTAAIAKRTKDEEDKQKKAVEVAMQVTKRVADSYDDKQREILNTNSKLGKVAVDVASAIGRSYAAAGLSVSDYGKALDKARDGDVQFQAQHKTLYNNFQRKFRLEKEILKEQEKEKQAAVLVGKRSDADVASEFLIRDLQNFKRYSNEARASLVMLRRNIADVYAASNTTMSLPMLLKQIRDGNQKLIYDFPKLTQAIIAFDRAVSHAEQNLNGFLFSAANLSRLVLARVVTAVFYRALNQVEQSLSASIELSKQLSYIQTISQDMQVTTDQWAKAVKSVSNAYGFLQTDLAEGLYQTISNQVALGEDAARFLENAAPFAKATRATMLETVDLLSSSMNAYGNTVWDLNKITSAWFKGMEIGRFLPKDFANSLGRVAPIAKLMGVELNELIAAYTVLTRKGMSAERAQTLVLNILNKLAKPTKDMTDLMHSWGAASGDAAVSLFGFGGVLSKISAETGGMVSEISDLMSELRAATGTAAIDPEEFTTALEQVSGGFEYYQRAVDIAMSSAGEVVSREINKAKNTIIGFDGKLIQLAARINEMTAYFGGLSNVITGGSLLTLGFGTGSLVKFKWGDNLRDMTQELRDQKKLWAQINAATGEERQKLIATLQPMGKMTAGLTRLVTSIPLMLDSLTVGLTLGALIADGIVTIAQDSFKLSKEQEQTNIKQTQQILTIGQQAQKARAEAVKAGYIPENLRQIYELNKALIDQERIIKGISEAWKDTLKQQELLEDTQKSALAKVKELLKLLSDQRQQSLLEGLDPLSALASKTDFTVKKWQQIKRLMAENPQQVPELAGESASAAKEVLKDYDTLIADFTKVDRLMRYGWWTGEDSAFNEAYQLLEKWSILPEAFGPALYDSIQRERSRILTILNESVQPLFELAQVQMPMGGSQALFDLNANMQALSDAMTVEREAQATLDGITESRDVLKGPILENVKSINDLLTVIAGMSTKAQEVTLRAFGINAAGEVIAPSALRDLLLTNIDALKQQKQSQQDLMSKKAADKYRTEGEARLLSMFVGTNSITEKIMQSANATLIETGDPALRAQRKVVQDYLDTLDATTLTDPAKREELLDLLRKLQANISQAFQYAPYRKLASTAYMNTFGVPENFKELAVSLSTGYLPASSAMNVFRNRYGEGSRVSANTLELLAQLQLSNQAATGIKSIEGFGLGPEDIGKSLHDVVIANYQSRSAVEANTVAINANTLALGGTPGFARGGRLPLTDTIPAMLSPGEFVVNARATRNNLALLNALNSGVRNFAQSTAPNYGGLRSYATGGYVSNNYQVHNNITLQSTGQESLDARRLVTAINREVYRGSLQLRTSR